MNPGNKLCERVNENFGTNIFEENYYESFKINDEEFITNQYFVKVKFRMNIGERTHMTSEYNTYNVGLEDCMYMVI